MDITRTALIQALHQIFDEHRVFSGGSMMLSQLEAAWTRTGLRRSDLADGLLGLTAQNEVELIYTDAGLAVKLLSYGRSQPMQAGERLARLTETARAGRLLAKARRQLSQHLHGENRREEKS